ncbi:MAG: membrane dipeptidase [Myxococcota bacterium]|nr:membrane dipeptidase [Myxococcota bacterium]
MVAAGCGWTPRLEATSAEALALHRSSLVLDLHVDTLLWTRLFGYDAGLRHQNRLPLHPFGFHFDLPRAQEAGLDAAVMGLVINPVQVRPELIWPLKALHWWEQEHGVEQALHTLDLLSNLVDAHPDEVSFVRRGSDILHEVEHGRFVAMAGLEGAHALEGDLSNLRRLYERGLRMVGLVHFQATAAGYPMTAPEFYGEGLTDFGRDLVTELEELGIVIDLAHLNAAGVWDALRMMHRPCVVSHTACKALHDHPRNLSDRQLELIGRNGGLVGVAAGRDFIGSGGIEAFLDHVEHVIEVAGPNSVALGSDYDGFIIPAGQMGDVRAYPLVTQGLLDRGQPAQRIAMALGANALRVLITVCG